MTPNQLAALQQYVAAVVRVMTQANDAHAQNVVLLLNSKRRLEGEFGMPLDYPDILSPPASKLFPDNLL